MQHICTYVAFKRQQVETCYQLFISFSSLSTRNPQEVDYICLLVPQFYLPVFFTVTPTDHMNPISLQSDVYVSFLGLSNQLPVNLNSPGHVFFFIFLTDNEDKNARRFFFAFLFCRFSSYFQTETGHTPKVQLPSHRQGENDTLDFENTHFF